MQELKALTRELSDKVALLTEHVDYLAESNEKLATSSRVHKRGLIALTVCGAILAGVIASVIFALMRIEQHTDRLDTQEEADVLACERSNETRAGQRQQWNETRKLLLQLGTGASTRAIADGLVANANKNFPHLDCSAIRRGEKPPVVPLGSVGAPKR